MKKKKNFSFIFITGLHNKSQGWGASVASAAGPFTKTKQKIPQASRPNKFSWTSLLWQTTYTQPTHNWQSQCIFQKMKSGLPEYKLFMCSYCAVHNHCLLVKLDSIAGSPCSGFQLLLIIHFNNIVLAFCDSFQSIRTRLCHWWVSFQNSPNIAHITFSSVFC
jgi:hypothetical protein